MSRRRTTKTSAGNLRVVVGSDGGPRQQLEVLIDVKPFSNNDMYGPRKYKTAAYKAYQLALFNALKRHRFAVHKDDKYQLDLLVGYQRITSDLDNALKPLLDSMQNVLSFDDKQIYEIHTVKNLVKAKESPYLCVRLTKITDNMVKRRSKSLFPEFADDIEKRWR